MTKHITAFLSIYILIAAPAFAHNDGVDSDSGIYGPEYSKLVTAMEDLVKAHPNLAETFYYGLTIQGRPLMGVKVFKKGMTPNPKSRSVFINGSIHGNEYLHIEDRMPGWVLDVGMTKEPAIQKWVNDGNAIYFVPILNPDGYDNRERENQHGQDLNRDFNVVFKGHQGFNEPETRALSEYLEKEIKTTGRKLALSMDYHCCIGAVLRPWSFVTNDPPASDLAKFQVVGNILNSVFGTQYQYGTTPVILGYEAVGTSKDYYYETYGTLSFTFEGRYRKEDKLFPEHTKMWTSIFDALNNGKL